jgi:hypothetical protein
VTRRRGELSVCEQRNAALVRTMLGEKEEREVVKLRFCLTGCGCSRAVDGKGASGVVPEARQVYATTSYLNM